MKVKGEYIMPKKKNLSGQRFGYLTVLHEETPKSGSRVKWVCQCQCGNITTVTTSDLNSGHTQSCGQCGITKNKADITGLRSGKLTAIKPTNKRTGDGSVLWECKCDCGNISYVKASDIKANNILSCGCTRTEKLITQNHTHAIDLTGQRFGKLVVIERAERPKYYKNNTVFWKCICDCGNISIVDGCNLRTGNTQSCGCVKAANSSLGQEKIKQILLDNNINFETEKMFIECKFPDTGRYARFDFYLPDFNILIEYDGIQHFIEGTGHYDNVEKIKITKIHDAIKNDFARTHGYILIRIPYIDYDNINLSMLLNK